MKRLKKILKWIAIFAAVLIAVLLMANAYFVWNTGTALERRLAELRQAGEPVQLSDLARAPIPPEQNADVYLRRAADDLEAIEKELLSMYPRTVMPRGSLSAPEKDKVRKIFTAFPRVIPLLEQAAACPDYDPQIDGSLPPSRFIEPIMERMTQHRVAARVLWARTRLLVAEGRFDDAITSSSLLLRLTRHWLREPEIIGYLVTLACQQQAMDGLNEALQAGPVSLSIRRALEAELALHDTLDGLRWALRSERAFSLSSVREFPSARLWISRGFANNLELSLLGAYDQVIKQTNTSFPEVIRSNGSAESSQGWLNPLKALVTLLGPAFHSAREASERTRALSRCLRVLNALQARTAPTGDPPPKLTELGLPPEASIDPYNGEPLHLDKTPAGWLVYSVGKNLTDDGGTLDGMLDLGAGPKNWLGTAKKP